MNNKDRAINDFYQMNHNSWTWERLTPEERDRFTRRINISLDLKAISGTYKQVYAQVSELYYYFLMGLGYDLAEIGCWRD